MNCKIGSIGYTLILGRIETAQPYPTIPYHLQKCQADVHSTADAGRDISHLLLAFPVRAELEI